MPVNLKKRNKNKKKTIHKYCLKKIYLNYFWQLDKKKLRKKKSSLLSKQAYNEKINHKLIYCLH